MSCVFQMNHHWEDPPTHSKKHHGLPAWCLQTPFSAGWRHDGKSAQHTDKESTLKCWGAQLSIVCTSTRFLNENLRVVVPCHGNFLCYASHDAFWNLIISQSLRPLVLFLTLFLNRTNLWLFRPTNRDHGRAPSRRVQKSRRKPWKQSACPKRFLSNLLELWGIWNNEGFCTKILKYLRTCSKL